MQQWDVADSDFTDKFTELFDRGRMDTDAIEPRVKALIDEIRSQGDRAVCEHIGRFDRWNPAHVSELCITAGSMQQAYEALENSVREALQTAHDRIRSFHEMQKPKSWQTYEDNGTILGQKTTPMDRAGLYIPGGKAAYPSSLLMNAIPAQVAGVHEIIVCTPTPDDTISDLLLAAMHLCGIKQAFKVGGATAVAAMAYGTETIPKVDVITGPGNIYVATAKKMVYGEVSIDMIAGPSEIGVLADESANPEWVAIDMLSQAEHDEMAGSVLITDSKNLAQQVVQSIQDQLARLSRNAIAKESVANRCWIITTRDMEQAVGLMNDVAPEHLEVCTKEPFALLPAIRHAGAIFLGHYTPEAIGDYIAGPNHTLPTGGTARFYSPLSTEHFMKKSSVIAFSKEGAQALGGACKTLADLEGLEAHGLSIKKRLE